MSVLASLLAFLIANGPSLISAGMSLAGLVRDLMGLIGRSHAEGRDLTETEFNAFVDRCLGNGSELDAIVAKAKAEVAAGG